MKCTVPVCRNIETSSAPPFFKVPSSGHQTFKKWTKYMKLSGTRCEKICQQHFKPSDFIIRHRTELKAKAVPSSKIPVRGSKLNPKGVCCITGCNIRKKKTLQPFPSQRSTLRRWMQILAIADDFPIAGLRICLRHFSAKDYCKVTRKYLKPNAVPSRKVTKIPKFPKRSQLTTVPPSHIWDHNYCLFFESRPRSNRICCVTGCFSRARDGISLHQFPSKHEKRFQLWLKHLNCPRMPTKHSRVCSNHFKQSDYTPGRRYLKKNAVPLPVSSGVAKWLSSSINSTQDSKRTSISSSSQDETEIDLHKQDTEEVENKSPFHPSDPGEGCSRNVAPAQYLSSAIIGSTSSNQRYSKEISLERPAFSEEIRSDDNVILSDRNTNKEAIDSTSRNQRCSTEMPQEQFTLNEEKCNPIYSEAEKSIRMNYIMILSDLLHTDKEVNIWTGIPSMEQLTEICLAVRTVESNFFPRNFRMHATDRVVLTLAKLKQNLSYEALGILFRISGVTVSKYFSHTIQILACILKQFIYWPTIEELRKNVPLCFREHFSNVTVVLDATEVPVATLKCLNCRISTYSNYKSRRTVKFLIGVSPAGIITFVSKAFSGKSSDKFIFNDERLIDRLEAHISEVMVDKGVSIDNECSTKCIKLHIPPFMKGNKLTPNEASRNEAIARPRVHVERVIQRVKIFGILTSTINTATLGHIDDIMSVVCGIVNLSPPILSDDKF